MVMNIPFNVLKPLYETLQAEMNTAVQRVLASGWYILGPEVETFESAFADYHGVSYAVGVANGTDAIELALRAYGIGAGDEVITVAHTAFATINAVERAGATPVMVDIDPLTYTLDPAAAEAAITPRTRAIVPVHIYGHPADIDALQAICDRHNLLLIEDCAQAHGARYKGQLVGTFGAAASFSFYPTKNLGAFGDGGAVITSDPQIAARLKSLRNYGQAAKYHHEESGQNSRLDELQAAILGVKLAHLDAHNATRQALAAVYDRCLSSVTIPVVSPDAQSVYHLYVVRHPQRDALMSCLKSKGIGTAIHYPIPNHLQPACAHLGYAVGSLPVTEQAAREIVSLPLYIGLSPAEVEEVSAVISREAGLLA